MSSDEDNVSVQEPTSQIREADDDTLREFFPMLQPVKRL